ncbi:MAG: hypothetical protein NE330_08545 [Lentisphaeraceae bacterium]|nr:hypothetical protein [Lentisphaeraceae bacterium]
MTNTELLNKVSFFATGKHPCWADYMPTVGQWTEHANNFKKISFDALESFNNVKKRLGQETDLNLPINLLYFDAGEYSLAQICESKDKVGRRHPLITGFQGADLKNVTLDYYFDAISDLNKKVASVTDPSEFSKCINAAAETLSTVAGESKQAGESDDESSYARLNSSNEFELSSIVSQLLEYSVGKFYLENSGTPLCFESPINMGSTRHVSDWIKVFSQIVNKRSFSLLFNANKITFIADDWLQEETVLAFTGSFPVFHKESRCSEVLIGKAHTFLEEGDESSLDAMLRRKFSKKSLKERTIAPITKTNILGQLSDQLSELPDANRKRLFFALIGFALVGIILLLIAVVLIVSSSAA